MSEIITPTIGRIVYFYPSKESSIYNDGNPLAAIICHVHDERLVNLMIISKIGNYVPNAGISIRLVQPNDDKYSGDYCTWMPYQIKKEYGSESGEISVGQEIISEDPSVYDDKPIIQAGEAVANEEPKNIA